METKTLRTKPVVTIGGKPCTQPYHATVKPDKHGRPILVIDQEINGKICPAGGTWSLSTLIGVDEWSGRKLKIPGRLALDFGQEWIIENTAALVSEALAIVLGAGED